MKDDQEYHFISYSRSDAAVVQKLAAALQDKGLRVWWDYQLTPGHQFRDTIAARIDSAKKVSRLPIILRQL